MVARMVASGKFHHNSLFATVKDFSPAVANNVWLSYVAPT